VHLEEIRQHCLKKKGVTEDMPFDEETLVFRVMNKIFLLMDIQKPITINLKCDPKRAVELREGYEEVTPGYHMNKKHWNTIDLNGSLSKAEILEMIDHSYGEVVKKLSKKEREEITRM